jgi:hypothetical protein
MGRKWQEQAICHGQDAVGYLEQGYRLLRRPGISGILLKEPPRFSRSVAADPRHVLSFELAQALTTERVIHVLSVAELRENWEWAGSSP